MHRIACSLLVAGVKIPKLALSLFTYSLFNQRLRSLQHSDYSCISLLNNLNSSILELFSFGSTSNLTVYSTDSLPSTCVSLLHSLPWLP
ncbi:uncharacterized protein LY79DRAFT_572012 [Colletotrichum navitas]|uniref:Uncharacterized protein n=1 Tax=Colletotrichum navitas TaxID=681940 RepID=A0AAD8UYX8_9PEZI|nr:uncharacterized protein LY79DRAFT_572012 [Colletotrichum navitas]KAK1569388.1 hypothetical protein LY79DRAFT_572012 [Colletotrichum navitas]